MIPTRRLLISALAHMASAAALSLRPSWARALIPRLALGDGLHHKGSHGKVAVVGGSEQYTGAPYYAAISALKTGGDLAYVLCARPAAVAIKAYSPELIVLPLVPAGPDADGDARLEDAVEAVGRAHAVVIGPGLGREGETLAFVEALLRRLIDQDVPTVLDGDALWALATRPGMRVALRGSSSVVLTPNAAEFARLEGAFGCSRAGAAGSEEEEWAAAAARLSAASGATVVRKGRVDAIVSAPGGGAITVGDSGGLAAGSPRRCGGQGDVLAGVLGVHLAWAVSTGLWKASAGYGQPGVEPALGSTAWAPTGSPSRVPTPSRGQLCVAAGEGASTITRMAAALAWSRHGRSTTTPDIIGQLGAAVEHALGEHGGEEGTADVEAAAARARRLAYGLPAWKERGAEL